MQHPPILIIGKDGKTGTRVNQRLWAIGYTTHPVSRSSHPAFDWENPETWRSAIEGTRAAYVTYHPDLAVPQAESDLRELFIVVFDGRNSQVMPGVEEALGRPSVDFKSYVDRTVASGVWGASERWECV